MAEDYDPGASSRPFGPQGDATTTTTPPAATDYDPGIRRSPLDIAHRSLPSTANGGVGVPWDSYEYPGGQPGDIIGGLKGLISGDSSVKRPEIGALNIPGLGLSVFDPRAWAITAHTAVSRDPAALEQAIKSRVPEATFSWDDVGADGKPAPGANRIVQVPGQPPMYLDRPGFTPQKGLFYGGQGAAALLTAGRSLPMQAGAAGAQHAASHATSTVLGGADSWVDPIGTAISTLMPVAIGGAGAGLIKGYDWLNSEVVPPAADAVRRLGVEGKDAVTQATAAVVDRAKKLYQFGFAGKPGDLTRDPTTLAQEDLAANAGWAGTRAKMDEFHGRNAQQTLLQKRQLVGEAAGDVPPGATVPDTYQPNEALFGNRVNDAIRARDASLDQTKRAAWDKLGPVSPSTPAGQSIEFNPEVSGQILPQAKQLLRERYGDPQGPNGTYTSAQLGESGGGLVNAVDQMERIMQPGGGPRLNPAPYQPFNLGHLQDLRQVLKNIMDEQPRGTPGFGAAARLKGQLDGAVNNAVTTGQIRGSPQALTDFRAANDATAAHFAFRNPEGNDPAASLIDSVLNPAAPSTGQETVSKVLGGGGTVTPGGGTNAILTHLQAHLGDDATKPLAGVTTMRSLYGTKGTTSEGTAAPARYDYGSTADRINAQIEGTGDEMATRLLSPEARARLGDFRDALNVLRASTNKAGPRLNAPGSGYIGMMSSRLPLGVGPIVDQLRLMRAANNATQGGAEIVNRAVGGATTPAGLGIRLPRQSTLQGPDPRNPFYSWQPGAWRAGTPVYRGGGLLGSEALDPANR
ncbi:MAG TPA: hypothetical protein VNO55_19750 [Polyangia bacterium]|nr:hypothetical protein [Polyangia bacterium]